MSSHRYLGGVTVGSLIPGAAGIHAQLLGKLSADLAAALSLNASLNASLSIGVGGGIDAAIFAVLSGQLLASLRATLAANVSAGISASLAANVALVAALQAAIDLLLLIDFGAAGLHAFAIDGHVNELSSEASAALASGLPGQAPTDMANGMIVATASPAAWQALGAMLLTG